MVRCWEEVTAAIKWFLRIRVVCESRRLFLLRRLHSSGPNHGQHGDCSSVWLSRDGLHGCQCLGAGWRAWPACQMRSQSIDALGGELIGVINANGIREL